MSASSTADLAVTFLLDTNVLSEPAKPSPSPVILAKLRQHQRRCYMAAPVWHELCFGLARLPKGRRHDYLAAYLRTIASSKLPSLPYDQRAAQWHARERARLAATGRTPSFVDGQIAAIAAVRGMTIVTRNVADFSAFRGVDVVDWFAEG